MTYSSALYTATDYLRDLEADAARWEHMAQQATGPYKRDTIATARYMAGLFRGIAAGERAAMQRRAQTTAAQRPRRRCAQRAFTQLPLPSGA